MKVSIESLLQSCEMVGGAASPPAVLGLCAALRQYAGIAADMAVIIGSGAVTGAELDELASRLERARVVEMPEFAPSASRKNPLS